MCRNNNNKLNLRDLNQSEIQHFIKDLGEKPFRADQICRWVFAQGVSSFDEMTNLSKGLRAKLNELTTLSQATILTSQVSAKGDTIKFLFGLPDGHAVESVLMKHTYGNSVCVSTQVGCRMGCLFCASTINGLVRNLSPGEIYDQVLGIQRETGERVSHIVIMGAGEPLDNFDNVLKFLENIHAEYGLNIGYRHITLSTCGLVPRMQELALRKLPITLAVSLHAPNDDLRDKLVPINRRYKIHQLIEACSNYIEITGRRITFEYALLSGINDSDEHVRQLAALLKNLLCHINLIPVNPVEEKEFIRTPPEKVERFRQYLEKVGLNVTVRRELGGDIDAACGQLRRRYESKN
ncbi:23S rRNA m(2)A-2503 methyltransferase [Desulforamulus reducens MI-1]|uniref:Probable dual-specificity RNA methyltransferase RlmN n=1 Tax=Desulforamulus reducens (strain ATCC BAA-1160 / DSM 100696 / MI-1) TaxID=349161 RepID=RLMN_DESRM|nr:23S rRNA (adenine(2503)-C(2))-methyltransferase RlmN [Desulforamulus reducens]A4J582.1 RecName: Full=Probable dual-specificity RNA methyltransferase RlmN; AltName: Full=23S rRNA (adenine(2503)-C(2))-methyltransferase; AltName: Full=23S rRNA m2A2503 methyltransferase; AltName: Full=Ribosomal RNA large subunit methyltransferase N; AltName: Full=tRNA (adenine(37)-C(2))-methyltransferase; AltName: Full=tRNA m2A37 methyltransferase [Desulforamulus reducens MI-1]ABO50235.1 23S rRNA m(2)A-2503 methyl